MLLELYRSNIWVNFGNLFKEINTFISYGRIQLIKSDSNNVYIVTKYFYSR